MEEKIQILELTLISAQDLKKLPLPSVAAPPSSRLHAYAVVSVDPSSRLRTHVDRAGGSSPTWNEKLLFLVPPSALLPDSTAAVQISIYASGLLSDSLLGSVRFLIGNQRLLSRPPGAPAFAAVGIRRPSGRFQGVLNLGTMLVAEGRVAAAARERMGRTGAAAVVLRDLIGENADPRLSRRKAPQAVPAENGFPLSLMKKEPPIPTPSPSPTSSPAILKERNREVKEEEKPEPESSSEGARGGGVLCWLGFPRKIHLSPSDQNLQMRGGGCES